MSGRALRRLPVLAHARYIGLGYTATSTPALSTTCSVNGPISGNSKKGRLSASGAPGSVNAGGLGTEVEVWLNAMDRVVESRAGELQRFEQ